MTKFAFKALHDAFGTEIAIDYQGCFELFDAVSCFD